MTKMAQMINDFWLSLCEGLIGPEYLEMLKDKKQPIIKSVTDFVLRQLSNLPIKLKISLYIGIFLFNAYLFIVTLQPIHRIAISKRKQIIDSWANGKIALTRKLFRPLRSLTLLAFFDEPEVISLLEDKQV
jgi:hypothetical protein